MTEWNEEQIRSACRSRAVRAELDRKSCMAKLRAGKDKATYQEESDRALAEWFVNDNLGGSDALKYPESAIARLNEIKTYNWKPSSVFDQEHFKKELDSYCDRQASGIAKTYGV